MLCDVRNSLNLLLTNSVPLSVHSLLGLRLSNLNKLLSASMITSDDFDLRGIE